MIRCYVLLTLHCYRHWNAVAFYIIRRSAPPIFPALTTSVSFDGLGRLNDHFLLSIYGKTSLDYTGRSVISVKREHCTAFTYTSKLQRANGGAQETSWRLFFGNSNTPIDLWMQRASSSRDIEDTSQREPERNKIALTHMESTFRRSNRQHPYHLSKVQ